ncbi:MAG: flippase-like domain-containing protein [Candidatus Krumholzibacteria bacterium]|nr:flippase-like domain-containing protein [Candidatus Krumholzibacteria bacterium]
MKKRTIVGLLISALLLYLAFRKVDFHLLGESLKRAEYIWLVPAFFLMLISVVFRAMRWRYLLRPVKETEFVHLFSASAIGLMANNLLPARLGEIARAWVIGEKAGISKTSSFATIVVERVFDGFTVIFFLVIVLIFGDLDIPASMTRVAYAAVSFYILAIVFLAMLRFNRRKTSFVVEGLTARLPAKASAKVEKLLHSFMEGLTVLKRPRDIAAAGMLSFLVWLPNILVMHLVIRSFGLDTSFVVTLAVFIIVTFGIMIPSAPGFVGTVQYCFVIGLGLFGVIESKALSISIIYHAGTFIPMTAAGLFCLAREGMSFSNLKAAIKEGEVSEEDLEHTSTEEHR